MKELKWYEYSKPTKDIPYNHVIAETPFGRFLITWKGWKEQDCPTIDETPWGDFEGAYWSVEEAKEEAQKMFFVKLKGCL